jgi:hypothetical protein
MRQILRPARFSWRGCPPVQNAFAVPPEGGVCSSYQGRIALRRPRAKRGESWWSRQADYRDYAFDPEGYVIVHGVDVSGS